MARAPKIRYYTKLNRHVLFATYALSIAIIIGMLVVSLWVDIPIVNFTRDPADLHHFPVYDGILSNLGVLVWCSTAVVCLFSLTKHDVGKMMRRYLASSGILSLILLIDDLFMVHDRLLPQYTLLPQVTMYVLYALFIIIWVITFRDIISYTPSVVLLAAAVLFGVSIITDVVADLIGVSLPGMRLLEETTKFLGIISWFMYFAHVGSTVINSEHSIQIRAGRRINRTGTEVPQSELSA